MRKVVVQKYGGSSVATNAKIRRVAELIGEKRRAGYDVVVVVSARGDTTDELLALAKEISAEPDRRELDMLLSAGERIAMTLLAMAIRELGFEAVSLTGSQSGIITNASHSQARIVEVRPFRVEDELSAGKIVIVAGYQGVSYRRDVTTLGRGGSDTTAVALAAALGAEACEIYSDVPGVFSADPRVVSDARKLAAIGYEEMQELARYGAQVLNATAVEFAREKGIALYARQTGSNDSGTAIRKDVGRQAHAVRAIAHEPIVMRVEAERVNPTEVRGLLEDFGAESIGVRDLSVHASGAFFCLIARADLHNEPTARARVAARWGDRARVDDRGTVTLVGDALSSDVGAMTRALRALESLGIRADGIVQASTRMTFVVPTESVERAVVGLHRAFVSDREVC